MDKSSQRSTPPKKNPYKVLRAPERHDDVTCIDLFAGAGGTALGFHNAGIHHVMLNENDPRDVETLRINSDAHNFGWGIVAGDVRELNFSGYSVDVIQAGFPCQAFSYAGKRMGFADTRGTLFFEFARAVEKIRPKIAVGENVRGLEKHDGRRTLATMLNTFDELGYNVSYRILEAQRFDVPQKRQRLIMIAVRNDLSLPIIFPRGKSNTITLRDAITNCPASNRVEYSETRRKVMELVPEGGCWRDLPENVARDYMGVAYDSSGGRTGYARRLSWDKPAPTLLCSPLHKQTSFCHPEETRPLTVREYARLQTFPDDWVFAGNIMQQYKQIGNAVPVNLGYHIGRAVLASLGAVSFDDRTMIKVDPLDLSTEDTNHT